MTLLGFAVLTEVDIRIGGLHSAKITLLQGTYPGLSHGINLQYG